MPLIGIFQIKVCLRNFSNTLAVASETMVWLIWVNGFESLDPWGWGAPGGTAEEEEEGLQVGFQRKLVGGKSAPSECMAPLPFS